MNKLQNSFLRAMVLALGCAFVFSKVNAQQPLGDSAQQSEDLRVLGVLFECLTRPDPTNAYFLAEQEVLEPSWSENQISEELQRQTAFMKDLEKNQSSIEKEAMRKFRESQIRKQHSGSRKFVIKEWLAPGYWKLDQIETTLMTNAPATFSNADIQESFVNIDDPSATSIQKWRADHKLNSATTDERMDGKWQQRRLWQAYTTEPEACFSFIIQVAAKPTTSRPPNPASLNGLTMDPAKVLALLKGDDKRFRLRVSTTNTARGQAHVVVFEGHDKTEAAGARMAFTLDTQLKRLYLIDVLTVSGKTYKSSRDEYDSGGFPRVWEVRQSAKNDRGSEITKNIKFIEVEMDAKKFDKSIFLPSFPTNYIVYSVDRNGNQKMVQNPRKSVPLSVERPLLGMGGNAPDDASMNTKAKMIFVGILLLATGMLIVGAWRNIKKQAK